MDEQDPSPRNSAKTNETGIDWISALPDSVIVEILCKIPITEACTTTILSKRWQYLSTCIHNLHCYRSYTGSGWSDKRLISFMDNALPLLTSSKIKSFTLHFTPNIALSNYYLDSDLYSLPQELCSSSSLGTCRHTHLTYNLYDDCGLDDVIDKSIVKDHLTIVACANELIIPSLYIEVSLRGTSTVKLSTGPLNPIAFAAVTEMISMLILQKEDVSLLLLECKRLTINSWISKYTFLGIDRLLHLKVDCTFINYWCEEEDNYANIFIIGSLRNLKVLKIILQWSPLIEDDTTTELTELMKCLFEHAKYLEKLVIVAETSDCSEVIQSLLALPRVSNSTVVVSSESVTGAEY
ncbi:hypothetical protein H5410_006049 [Solanum commersonii]|uniref:F-box domain-containing protein n=1 Tax=Solanum commersonii TaxID=4109 RepID=A0A9J6AA38_SOLCO|nr:hypothetical protein H5410_006049 [Solanum commersonii]